jgi:hypothetical protein
MRVVCPQRWDKLAATAHADVRHCDACRRDVHYCTTVERAHERVRQGHCVVVDVREASRYRRGDFDDLGYDTDVRRLLVGDIDEPS